jgi:hypothetical protein
VTVPENIQGPKVEPAILQAKHPEVKRLESTWERIRILVEEDEAKYVDFLTKLPREEEDDYKRRKESYLLGFTNPSQELVTVPGDYILRRSVDRKTDSADLQAFIAKADRSGQSLNDFVRNQASPMLTAYGTVIAVVDKPRVLAASKADERNRAMPYISILGLDQVRTFRWGKDGSLAMFRYWQAAETEADNAFTMPSEGAGQYVTWTKTEWFLHNEKGELIDYLQHGFGVVPVVIQAAFTMDGRRTLGKSTFFSSSRHILMGNKHLSVANYEIEKYGRILMVHRDDWDEDQVTRQKEADTNLPKMTSKAAESKIMRVSDMANRPAYLVSDIEIIDKANEQAWKYFGLAAETESSGREANPLSGQKEGSPQSGVAKAYDFQDMNANLYAKAMDLQEFEKSALAVVAIIQRYKGPISVKYPETFDLRGFKEKIEEVSLLKGIEYASPTGLRLAMAGLTNHITADESLRKTIDTEIKQAPTQSKPPEKIPEPLDEKEI